MNQNAVIAAEAVSVESRGARLLQRSAQSFHIDAVTPGEPRRGELEHYVRLAFAHKHGAAVRTFMPTLLSFRDHADSLRGVAGLRGAHEDRLYLEQYLDIPVECALTAALAETFSRHRIHAPVRKEVSPIKRAAIVEVGNLAGASCRAAVRMVAQLPAYLIERRYQWIVFTATSALRDILTSLGAPLLELATADCSRVDGAYDEWGRYYETDPRVYAGYLRDAEGLAGFVTGSMNH